ncbi:MAG: FAD-dependent oxidoreductase, partial [Microbacterium sp.]
MTPEQTPELAERAARQHVVVIGGGIGGLVAARECAKLGMPVTLLEASAELGGSIRRIEVDGLVLDAGAESFATRGGHVRALLAELGLTERVVRPEGGGAWLDGIPGVGAAPLPTGGLLGIPENPFQDDVRRILGTGGVWRAYLDRLRPPLTIGHEKSLGKLVARRMGEKVRDRLVAPVTAGVYSAHPDDVDVEAAAPGLSAALTTAGSLSGAVAMLRGERAKAGAPGAAVEGLDGGMGMLVDALRTDLETLGVEIRTGVRAESLVRDGASWAVRIADAASEASVSSEPSGSPGSFRSPEPSGVSEPFGSQFAPESGANGGTNRDLSVGGRGESGTDVNRNGPGGPRGSNEPGGANELGANAGTERLETLQATGVIVATAEPAARALLDGQLDLGPAVPAPEVEIVTLVLDAPNLDAAPRGTGVLIVPGSRVAKALTHSTAKWGWLRSAAAGRHVVRVSFGTQGEPAATASLDEEAAAELALAEASGMLGVALRPTQLRGARRERFVQSQPGSAIGAAERRARMRTAVQ